MKVLNRGANQFIRELTTPLKIKPMLVVKNTHTELLLLSESIETQANTTDSCAWVCTGGGV